MSKVEEGFLAKKAVFHVKLYYLSYWHEGHPKVIRGSASSLPSQTVPLLSAGEGGIEKKETKRGRVLGSGRQKRTDGN